MERATNVMFRGPSGRVITAMIRRSITFNPRGLKVRPGRVEGEIRRSLGDMNVCRLESERPRLLSNKRGREMTVTNVVTVGPGYVVFSRTATVLSPSKEGRMVGAVGELGGRRGVAALRVARFVRRTISTSEIVIVRGNGGLLRNAPGRIFDGVSALGGVNLSIPYVARLSGLLGSRKLSVESSVLAMSRVIVRLYRL